MRATWHWRRCLIVGGPTVVFVDLEKTNTSTRHKLVKKMESSTVKVTILEDGQNHQDKFCFQSDCQNVEQLINLVNLSRDKTMDYFNVSQNKEEKSETFEPAKKLRKKEEN